MLLKRVFYWSSAVVLVVVVTLGLRTLETPDSTGADLTPESSSSRLLVRREKVPRDSAGHVLKTSPSSPSQPLGPIASMRPRPHFFDNKLLRSTEEILSSEWVARLREMLGVSGAKKQVSVVFGNYPFLDSVLNWLIAAKVRLKPPLEDVIVVCLDEKIFKILDERDIPSIYINHTTVINTEDLEVLYIFILRMVVFRLINHFGHDVTAYDSDAILVRNPQTLWDKHHYSDIVSSTGRWPLDLNRKWGFTACMGVMLIRSTSRTELLWESISSNLNNDQILMNMAINDCHIQWDSKGKDIAKQFVDGRCPGSGLRVTVLSRADICRRCNSDSLEQGLYVWHQSTLRNQMVLSKARRVKGKLAVAKKGSMWFLRSSWNRIDSARSQKGTEWLYSVSTDRSTIASISFYYSERSEVP